MLFRSEVKFCGVCVARFGVDEAVEALARKILPQLVECSRVSRALQNLQVDEIANADGQRVGKQLIKKVNMRHVATTQVVDPDGGVDEIQREGRYYRRAVRRAL